jgi:hypothetical protein
MLRLNGGGDLVKHIRWTFLLFLLGAVLIWAVPPVDAPDSASSEIDTPAAVLHPVLPRLRVMSSPAHAGTGFEPAAQDRVAPLHSSLGFTRAPEAGELRNLQQLLCTFLI